MAKLAARKRMKEELNKENAVAGELDRITKAQVGDQSLSKSNFDTKSHLGNLQFQ